MKSQKHYALVAAGLLSVVSFTPTASAAVIQSSTAYEIRNGQILTRDFSQDSHAGQFNESSAMWTFLLDSTDPASLASANLTLAYDRDVNQDDTTSISIFVKNSLLATDEATAADRIPPSEDPAPSGWTLIQQDFVFGDGSANDTNVSLNSTGQANLLSFLQNNWVAGQYLAVSAAVDLNGESLGQFDRFEFDRSAIPDNAGVYQLSYELIPEPSATALLLGALGTVMLLRRRR